MIYDDRLGTWRISKSFYILISIIRFKNCIQSKINFNLTLIVQKLTTPHKLKQAFNLSDSVKIVESKSICLQLCQYRDMVADSCNQTNEMSSAKSLLGPYWVTPVSELTQFGRSLVVLAKDCCVRISLMWLFLIMLYKITSVYRFCFNEKVLGTNAVLRQVSRCNI